MTAAARWRAASAVAATYFWFLLFAQFGFLRLVRERLSFSPQDLQPLMATMGIAGLMTCAATIVLLRVTSVESLTRVGFLGCAGVSLGAAIARTQTEAMLIAAGCGIFLSILTVALATGLRDLARTSRVGLVAGCGTGVAYLLCNVPALFEAPPVVQCLAATIVALGGAAAVPRSDSLSTVESSSSGPTALEPADVRGLGFVAVIFAFLALVWLDSAAFTVIQQNVALKATTWGSPAQKSAMGITHLVAAVVAGWWLDRGGLHRLLVATFVLFVTSFTLLSRSMETVLFAGPMYATGISLYSTALVAYPSSFGDLPGLVPRRLRAAAVYGICGWLGSALGVGMAQQLRTIPGPFLVVSGGLVLAAWLIRRLGGPAAETGPGASDRNPPTSEGAEPSSRARAILREPLGGLLVVLAVGIVLGSNGAPALLSDPVLTPGAKSDAPAVRGRSVYIGEGCVNCHSQYVRPVADDLEPWGPFRPLENEHPVLVGNRRLGPDLRNVGNRRSATWLRLHLSNPRQLSPGSRMPSYGHLFAAGDRRGPDLVAYLASLGEGTRRQRARQIDEWRPTGGHVGDVDRGRRAFTTWCHSCHGPEGGGDGTLASSLSALSTDLHRPALRLVSWGAGLGSLEEALQRLIKFGLPGTDMPGHETMSGREIADLAAYVLSLVEPSATSSEPERPLLDAEGE